MRRFIAVLKKEFRQIRRDPLSLGLLIFNPALLLVLYGYALSFDIRHLGMGILDYSKTQDSRRLQDNLFKNPYFDCKMHLDDQREAQKALDQGKVKAVIVIPPDYANQCAAGKRVAIQVLVDGTDSTTASTVNGYLDAMSDRASRDLRMRLGVNSGSLPMVTIEPRVWFNPELESSHFLVPGVISMLLMLASVVATSLSLVREKERQTMEQISVSPIRPLELLLGKNPALCGHLPIDDGDGADSRLCLIRHQHQRIVFSIGNHHACFFVFGIGNGHLDFIHHQFSASGFSGGHSDDHAAIHHIIGFYFSQSKACL